MAVEILAKGDNGLSRKNWLYLQSLVMILSRIIKLKQYFLKGTIKFLHALNCPSEDFLLDSPQFTTNHKALFKLNDCHRFLNMKT